MNIILRTRQTNLFGCLSKTLHDLRFNHSKVKKLLAPLCGCQYQHKTYSTEVNNDIDKKYKLMYESPAKNYLKWGKRISLLTAIACCGIAPSIMTMESIPYALRFEIASSVFIAGVPTTCLLHYFSRMYINKLYLDFDSDTILTEKFNFIGMTTWKTFHMSECKKHGTEPFFSTFYVGKQKQLLHTDVANTQHVLSIIRKHNGEDENTTDSS